MKFKISRTSDYLSDACPVEGKCIQRIYDKWHSRTCSEKEFDERFSQKEGKWRSKGSDHGITDQGYITRKEDEPVLKWVIEINTIEQLLALIDAEGSIVILNHGYDTKGPEIEIYDSYRE